jgi:hypothetical protein
MGQVVSGRRPLALALVLATGAGVVQARGMTGVSVSERFGNRGTRR